MKPTKHCVRTLLIILIVVSFLLSGCTSNKREKKEERTEAQKVQQDTPLLVFITSA